MKKVDLYLANLAVLNVKLHNLHWNVVGINFKAIHEYLEELYDSALEKFDEVAEWQKMEGKYPKASLKEYLEISEIKEIESKDYSGKDAIKITIDDLKLMRKTAVKISEDSDCFVLSNMMEDHVTEYNKHIWFLETMLK